MSGWEGFRNLKFRGISDEEIAEFDRVSRGLDWGYAVDPLHYTVNHFDRARRRLYIFFELRATGMSNRRLAEEIAKENPEGREVICDSNPLITKLDAESGDTGDGRSEGAGQRALRHKVVTGFGGNCD